MNLNKREADAANYFLPNEEDSSSICADKTKKFPKRKTTIHSRLPACKSSPTTGVEEWIDNNFDLVADAIIDNCDRIIALFSDRNTGSKATQIILDPELLLEYIFSPTDLVDRSVHGIVGLLVEQQIACYIIYGELERAFDRITDRQISEYALKRFARNANDLPKEDSAHSLDINTNLLFNDPVSPDRQRIAVMADIKQRIELDFEIVDADEDLNKSALALELLDKDLAVKIAYAERHNLTAVVTTSTLLATLPEWYRPNIRIYDSANFMDWYTNGLSDASLQIQSYNERSNTTQVLNELAGFPSDDSLEPSIATIARSANPTRSLRNAPLPVIGRGWYFAGFEVYSTAQLLVSATLKLEDRKHKKEHIFIGTGNGMISALLNTVDKAVIYLLENGIVQKELPTAKDISLFHIIDCDRDVNAPVVCKIVFSHQGKSYFGTGKHTDTVKAALLAYASALEAVADGNDELPDRSLTEGSIIASKHKNGYRDFSNQNYRNIRLIDHNLNYANFSGSDLSSSTIAECKLTSCAWLITKLIASKWTANNLAEADLTKADFSDSTLTANNFNGSNLCNVNFTGSTLTANDLTDADLTEANFSGSTLTVNNFTRVNLFGAILNKVIAKWGNFVKAVFQNSVLVGAILIGSNFSDTDFAGADLENADLTNTIFMNANLTGANLTNANLTDANLTNANLTDANLFGAKTTGANFTNANLTGTNFAKANLLRVIFAGANTWDANFTGAILEPSVDIKEPTTDS
jgi:uncharacterized protein YjbI with pentapeptide repeats